MIFKSLILHGFKSFADRTEFHFDEGITGVVGPNGCGKSNIVDAVKWVLGAQSAKSLRGRQMTDLIFTGSGTRKSASMAQVDLVFDNTTRRLPIDQDQITVTRRLYRSGESEYILNKQTVRLKDIRELFLDTGLGADAYSMIEQGRVDALLQANPIERRGIFEEAAGIAKYKARRKEAERKLERVEQNLLRVRDIVEEVEKQLRSVKLQAGRARSYQQYTQRLAELRSAYVLAEYHRLTQEYEDTARREQHAADAAAGLRTVISRADARTAELDVEVLELNEAIQGIDDQGLRLQAEIRTHEERISQSRQRMAEQEDVLARCRTRLVSERQHAASVRARRERTAEEVSSLDGQVRTMRNEIATVVSREEQEARRLTEGQAELDDVKSGLIDLIRRSSSLSNEIHGLDVHRQGLSGQKQRLSDRDTAISEELQSVMVRKAELDRRLREVEALISEQTRRLEEKKTQAAQVAADRELAVGEVAAAKEERSALQSRRQVLDDLARQLEGVEAGARDVLRRRDADETQQAFSYIVGMVGELLETDVQHSTVVEAALGELDQYLVVSDSRRFFADIGGFSDWAGRVSVICLDRIPPYVASPDLAGEPGVIARAIDLVRPSAHVGEETAHGTTRIGRDGYDRLMRHLLDRTVVVETLEDGRRLSGILPVGHRFVTPTGQVLEADGRVLVGPSGTRAGLVSRQSQLTDLDQQLAENEQRLAVVSDRANRLSAEANHLDRRQQELRTAVYEAHTVRAETASRVEQAGEAVARLSREQPLIAGEMERIQQAINEAVAAADENKNTLAEVERLNREREAHVAEIQQRVDESVAHRTALRDQIAELRIEHGQLTEKQRAAVQRAETLDQEAEDADAAAARAGEEAAECTSRIEQGERAILGTQSRLAELYLTKERIRAEALRQRRVREQVLVERERIAAEIKKHRDELEIVEATLHELQMGHQETRVRREELVSRVQDELQIDLAEQYESADRSVEGQDEAYWEGVENEMADLRGKIDRLGHVNLDAIQEQQELEERLGFMTTQLDDLTGSQRQLDQLIGRLNKESRERFITAFEEIRRHFQELYRRLFGGGKADIFLEDEDDVLDSGIEIVARPPGKELQRLSLLSGGEKSMTAIALLLAIFRSKPSPFAILDEVDAALDEANNERFNRIIQDFATTSQFIVVTHSKRTMAITNRLYGVTMQEAGVSKLVSVKFEDASNAA